MNDERFPEVYGAPVIIKERLARFMEGGLNREPTHAPYAQARHSRWADSGAYIHGLDYYFTVA